MSVEMMENEHQQDKQELRQQYCKVANRGLGLGGQMRHDHDHDPHAGDQGLRMKPQPHHDHGNNKHSYFLRAKTPRFNLGFQVGDAEDGEFKKPSPTSLSEEEDLANCLVMLSNKSHAVSTEEKEEGFKGKEVVEKGTFQCKACKKVFNSHQALGGHRASHKKVKGCFASKIEGLNEEDNMDDQDSIQEDQEPPPPPPPPEPDSSSARPTPSAARKRTKMHECSVCRRVFSSGQALGGHKRCHWLTTSTDNAFIPNFQDFQYDHRSQQLCKKPIFTKPHQHDLDHQLDLNLNLPPAPLNDRKHDNGGNGDKTSKYEASTRLCLQQWTDQNQPKSGNDVIDRSGEEGCGMKLRKLSDLRDVNLDGGWLQMGIPSTEMR